MIFSPADATAAITVPAASSTAACPTLGTVAEGTQTGTVVTVAATGGGALSYALGGTDAAMFAVSAAGVITIAGSAVLDFDTKTSYTVQVT